MKKVPNKKVNRQTCFFQICNSSFNLSFREVIDRENKRRKRETNVLETRKTKREKETTDEQMYEQKDIKRERMHVKSDKLKSFLIQKGNCCSKK